MFWCKIHKVKGEVLVAVCDESLLGKKIGKKLKVHINESFYKGKLVDKKNVLESIKKSTICNLMGKEIVKISLEERLIIKENIIFIDDIPHAQIIQ
jgi:hypothetical protein